MAEDVQVKRPPVLAVHPPCGLTWSGKKAEHCPACCLTFSSTSAGDLHRLGDYTAGTRCCMPPELLGLVLRDCGGPVWGFPGDPAGLARKTRTTRAEAPEGTGLV